MTDTKELVPVQLHAIMPVMDVRQAVARRNAIVQFVREIMQPNVHYGKVPGTDKDTLLKPGAEMLTTFFGLSPHFLVEEKVQDWTGGDHGGEPFFYFQYRCQLCRGDLPVGEGIGSCNSWEKKYRYRRAALVCPACGADAISRSRYPPRGAPQGTVNGWWCRDCKTDFAFEAPEIADQEQGQVFNPNPADLVNTIDKMAQKRSLVAATLIAVNASEFFTQDLEDMALEGEFEPVEAKAQEATTTSKSPRPKAKAKATNGKRPYSAEAVKARLAPIVTAGSTAPATDKQRQLIASKLNECFAEDPDADKKRHTVTHYLFGFESTNDAAMKQGHVDATLKWILLDGNKDDTGDYPLHPKAPAEAAAIVREALLTEGQTEFDVAAEDLFDVMEGSDV